MVKLLLKLEYLSFLILGVSYFFFIESNWLLLVGGVLLPDIGMVGYLINNRIGAISYNALHTYVLVVVLIFLGIILQNHWLQVAGAFFAIHISIDRLLGYGLKYPTGFQETHLQK